MFIALWGRDYLNQLIEVCLAFELRERGMKGESQKALPGNYRGVVLDCGYRIDLLIEDLVIVELKAVEKIEKIHEAQLLSYFKLSQIKIGLLINFNVEILKDGIRRRVLNL